MACTGVKRYKCLNSGKDWDPKKTSKTTNFWNIYNKFDSFQKWQPQNEHGKTFASFYLLISIGADPCCFIKFSAINIWIVTECSIAFSNRSSPSLVLKMPMKTREGSVLCAFVLQEEWTLLCPKLLQITANTKVGSRYIWCPLVLWWFIQIIA